MAGSETCPTPPPAAVKPATASISSSSPNTGYNAWDPTERTDTFESELNAAAATGYRLLPTALFWTTRRAALRGQITELIGVVEKQPDARPLHYRLLAVRRVPTLAAELAAAASDGYEFSTMATGAELAVVLHKQP